MTTLTFHLNLRQSSIAKDGRWISIRLHLCVPIWLQTLIQMVWPASLHLTHSSSFMLWAELPGHRERMYSSWSDDYNGSSSTSLKYDWNVSEYSFEFNEQRLEALCAQNLIRFPCQASSCSCDIKRGETAQYLATYGSFDLGMSVPSSLIL